MMLPDPPEDKESSPSPTPKSARRPGPSRFLVPVGQRVAEDAVASVSAASFLSRDKICAKIKFSISARSSLEDGEVLVTNGIKQEESCDSSDDSQTKRDDDELKLKRGPGRPPKDRHSLPGLNFEKSTSVSSSSSTASGPVSRIKSSMPATNLINKIEEINFDRKRRCRSVEIEEPLPKVDKTETNGKVEVDDDDDDDEIIFASRPAAKDARISTAKTSNKDSTDKEEEVICLSTKTEFGKVFNLKDLKVSIKDVINSNKEMPQYSRPGPLSTKILSAVQKEIKVAEVTAPTILPGSPISTRTESRDSISIEVIDEFVVDEISPYKPVATIKVVDSEEDKFEDVEPEILTTTKSGRKVTKPKLQNFVTSFKGIENLDSEVEDNEDDDASILSQNKYEDETGDESSEAEILTTTKSGRKVTRPKPQNVVTSIKGIKNLDSEIEDTEDDEKTALSKEKLEEYKKLLPIKFEAGDLAWARIGVAPYWPCTVTLDPDENLHTNVCMRGKKAVREYHVQFFGRVQRAWVSDVSLLKFETLEAFQKKAEEVKKATGSFRKKYLKAFTPSSSARAHWNEALNKMLEVQQLCNTDRLEFARKLLVESGQHRTYQASLVKRKHHSSCSSTATNKPREEPAEKRPKPFKDADNLIKAIPQQVLDVNRRKLKSGFKLFKLAYQSKWKKSDKNEEIERKLSRMWNHLHRKERQFYCEESFKISSPTEESEVEEMDVSDSVESKTKTAIRLVKNASPADNECEIVDDEDQPLLLVKRENDKQAVKNNFQAAPKDILETATNKSKAMVITVIESTPEKVANPKRQSINAAAMIGLFKKENCCIVCELVSQKPGDLIKCKGICQNSFHIECLKLDDQANTETWKCEECTSGSHPCMLCNVIEGDRMRCSIPSCGKFFHRSCLKSGLWPQARFSETQLTCPGHMCHTCASDNPQDPFMKYNSRLVRCIRCPTAYHAGDYCIAAGSIQITASQIVCPKHYNPPKSKKGASTHINTSWCFICSNGGTLICCELCPASFHAECLKIDPPEGLYYCDSCETGKLPLYGEVLWVKLGNYRWWPSKVLHPSEIPDNIERLPHDVGEFPIQFCGTKEYFWMNRGRCYPYQEGDSDKIPGSAVAAQSSLAVSFRKGVAEAAEIFDAYTEAKNVREAANANKVHSQPHLKPPLFSKIKSNKPFGDVSVRTIDPVDSQVCECDPNKNDPCGKDADCLNRMLMLECCPSMCRAKEKCGNMQFQRRVYPPMAVCRTSSRGWGLFIKQDVKKGDFLIEYVGELITTDEFKKRVRHMLYDKDAEQNYYYMVMDNSRVIDAGPKGNIARFMNHSCNPNCETQKWTVNGDTRIGLFALEDIAAGNELTFNYQLEAFGEVKKLCLCGAKNCSGFIGEKPTKDTPASSNGLKQQLSGDSKKKKLKKVKQVKVWEDICYRCFDGGQLLMCDYKSCPKVYHMDCVDHETRPREKWFCPWHHCVACGSAAIQHCIHCPNAYCGKHDSVLKTHPKLGKICNEHSDDFGDILKFFKKTGGVDRLTQDPYNPSKMLEKDTNKDLTTLKPKVVPSPAVIFKPRPAISKSPEIDIETLSSTTPKASEKLSEETALSTPNRPINELDSSMSKNGSARTSERLYQCPGCELEMRASLIRRHILAKHPNIGVKSGVTDGDALEKALASANTTQVTEIIRVKPINDLLEKTELKDVRPRYSLPSASLNSVPSSEACILCAAPGCNKYIHHSNMARHWRCWHPDLNKADFIMKRPSFSKSSPTSPASSPIKPSKTADNQLTQSLNDHRTSTSLPPSKTQVNAGVSGFNLPMANGLYACKSGDCDYKTRYNSNMWRHRRKYNHFLDTDVSSENCHTATVQQAEKPAVVDAGVTSIEMSKEVISKGKNDSEKGNEVKAENSEDSALLIDDSMDDSMYEEVEEMDVDSNKSVTDEDNKDDFSKVIENDKKETETKPKPDESNSSKSDSMADKTEATKTRSGSISETTANDKNSDLQKSPVEKSRNKITSYFMPLAKSSEKVAKAQTPISSDVEKAKKNITDLKSMDISECKSSKIENPVTTPMDASSGPLEADK